MIQILIVMIMSLFFSCYLFMTCIDHCYKDNMRMLADAGYLLVDINDNKAIKYVKETANDLVKSVKVEYIEMIRDFRTIKKQILKLSSLVIQNQRLSYNEKVNAINVIKTTYDACGVLMEDMIRHIKSAVEAIKNNAIEICDSLSNNTDVANVDTNNMTNIANDILKKTFHNLYVQMSKTLEQLESALSYFIENDVRLIDEILKTIRTLRYSIAILINDNIQLSA